MRTPASFLAVCLVAGVSKAAAQENYEIQFGPWYVSLNPVLERSFAGRASADGFEFSPNAKVAFDFTSIVAAVAEYYGSLGPLGGFDRRKDQQHQIFPTPDVDLGPEWEVNVGVGIGLTPTTDDLIVKAILGRRFGL